MVSSIAIAPAERYVVDVEFGRAGRVALVNRVQALDHMMGTYAPEVDTLGSVRVSQVGVAPRYAAQFAELRRNADVAAELAPLRARFDAAPAHSLAQFGEDDLLQVVAFRLHVAERAGDEQRPGLPASHSHRQRATDPCESSGFSSPARCSCLSGRTLPERAAGTQPT